MESFLYSVIKGTPLWAVGVASSLYEYSCREAYTMPVQVGALLYLHVCIFIVRKWMLRRVLLNILVSMMSNRPFAIRRKPRTTRRTPGANVDIVASVIVAVTVAKFRMACANSHRYVCSLDNTFADTMTTCICMHRYLRANSFKLVEMMGRELEAWLQVKVQRKRPTVQSAGPHHHSQ